MKEYKDQIASDKKERLAKEAAAEKRREECQKGKCEQSNTSDKDDMETVRSTDHTGAVSEK